MCGFGITFHLVVGSFQNIYNCRHMVTCLRGRYTTCVFADITESLPKFRQTLNNHTTFVILCMQHKTFSADVSILGSITSACEMHESLPKFRQKLLEIFITSRM